MACAGSHPTVQWHKSNSSTSFCLWWIFGKFHLMYSSHGKKHWATASRSPSPFRSWFCSIPQSSTIPFFFFFVFCQSAGSLLSHKFLPTAAISCPYWSCSFLRFPVLIPLSRGNTDIWTATFFLVVCNKKSSLNTYWALSYSLAWLLLPNRHPLIASVLPQLTSDLQSWICFVNSLFLEFMALENSTSGLSFR